MSEHICIYSDDPDKGGVASYNHELAMGMVARGHRVTLVQSRSTSEATRTQAQAGIQHQWLDYDTGREFVRTITDSGPAARAFQAAAPEVVLFSDCCAISNIAAKHAAIGGGIPFVTIVHNAGPYLAERFAACLPVMKGQFAQAREVITVSSENVRVLRTLFGLPADKGLVIFPGASARFFEPLATERRDELRRTLGLGRDTVVSFTAARLDAMKGFVFQLYAMELLRLQFPKSKLVCVWAGEGDARAELSAEIAKKKLGAHIRLVGRQQDISAWLDAADLFTLTSLTEGMPISIMEAMSRARPVVSTTVGGVAEELGDTGVLLPDANTKPKEVVFGLAKAWQTLESQPHKRAALGRAARERALEHFQIDGMIDRTLEVVERALSSAKAA